MQTVDVTIKVPQAEKDLADAIVKLAKDIQKKDWKGLVSDSIGSAATLASEFKELGEEFKSPLSANAELYLQGELEKVFIPSIEAAPANG